VVEVVVVQSPLLTHLGLLVVPVEEAEVLDMAPLLLLVQIQRLLLLLVLVD
tara:strand:- start:632 stop:784 length:153 start_codon:yes stop_codon:yes gene_type:complete